MASGPLDSQPAEAAAAGAPGELVVNLQILSPSVGVNRPLLFPDLPAVTTIKQLKDRIRQALPLRPADENQRLIHRGRALLRESDNLLDVFGADAVSTMPFIMPTSTLELACVELTKVPPDHSFGSPNGKPFTSSCGNSPIAIRRVLRLQPPEVRVLRPPLTLQLQRRSMLLRFISDRHLPLGLPGGRIPSLLRPEATMPGYLPLLWPNNNNSNLLTPTPIPPLFSNNTTKT